MASRRQTELIQRANARQHATLWDTDTRKELGYLTGHEAWVSSLCFSEDGKTLVSGGADQTIRFWDLATRREMAVYQGHHAEIWALSYAPDRRTLWSGGKDGSVLVWGVEPSSKPMALASHQ